MTVDYTPCPYHTITKGVTCCVEFMDDEEIDGEPISLFSHKGLLYISTAKLIDLDYEQVTLSYKEVQAMLPMLQAFVDDLGEEWK